MEEPSGLVIAIDGPAGAGKSTVAKGVARALGIAHLDTGAMYRAVTAKALAEGADPADADEMTAVAARTELRFTADGLYVDGVPAGDEIRSPEVNRWVSTASAHPGVRAALVETQRKIMAVGDIVAEGRDIGTIVAPAAEVKIFLTASPEERARRRHAEVTAAGHEVSLERLAREIEERDRSDSTREASPLTAARDAVLLDTTGKTPDQVVDEIVAMARAAVRR